MSTFLTENHKHFQDLMYKTWEVNGRLYNLMAMGWSFGYNSRKSSFGVCKSQLKRIELSKLIFELNPDFELFDDTIRHEIAHAIDFMCRGTSDHGAIWVNIAKQVGCVGERTATLENQPKGKYTLVCPNGHTRVAHRRPKRSKSCGTCNPNRFDEAYKFKIIQNY